MVGMLRPRPGVQLLQRQELARRTTANANAAASITRVVTADRRDERNENRRDPSTKFTDDPRETPGTPPFCDPSPANTTLVRPYVCTSQRLTMRRRS